MGLEDLSWAFDLGERLFTADKWVSLYRTWEEYELVSNYLEDGQYSLVAWLKNKPAGFVLGTTVDKKSSRWKYGYIVWLAVEPEFSGQGIATKLVEELTQKYRAAGIHIMMADTATSNSHAISFFERAGFDEQEEHLYMFKSIKQGRSKPANRRSSKVE